MNCKMYPCGLVTKKSVYSYVKLGVDRAFYRDSLYRVMQKT